MSEQSGTELATGIQGLADFLGDTPIEESPDEELASDTEPEESDNQDESEDTEQDESEDDAAEETAPRTFKVHIHGEDGNDTEVEVHEEELVKGYQRQADYTRKTQELSQRESEVTQALAQKHSEYRDYYLHHAEAAKQAIVQIAGIKSPQELYQLSLDDPAGCVAEKQRQEYLSQVLNGMDQQINATRQQAMQESEAQQKQAHKEAADRAWSTLQREGIDRNKLTQIYADFAKEFGYQEQELLSNMDARAVLAMRELLEYRALKAKSKSTAKVAKDAPRIPNKRNTPQQTRKDQALDAKFKSGRAKLNDLAAFLR